MNRKSFMVVDEPPLIVVPSLAVRAGLREAIFIQQLHYHLVARGKKVKGVLWFHRSIPAFADKDFPFWSVNTIQRVIKSCEDQGLIKSAIMNEAGYDKTKSYTIEYCKIDDANLHDRSPQVGVTNTGDNSSSSKKKKGEAKKAKPAKPSVFDTNLLPELAEVWTEVLGGAFPYGQAAGQLKAIAPALREDGVEAACDALRAYLKSLSSPGFASMAKFSQTYGSWKQSKKKERNDTRGEALQ